MEKEYRIRPYYKSELAQAYAPDICPGAALNRLAQWIKTNTQLTEALKETNYRVTQRMFTSRQVALIFESLGVPSSAHLYPCHTWQNLSLHLSSKSFGSKCLATCSRIFFTA